MCFSPLQTRVTSLKASEKHRCHTESLSVSWHSAEPPLHSSTQTSLPADTNYTCALIAGGVIRCRWCHIPLLNVALMSCAESWLLVLFWVFLCECSIVFLLIHTSDSTNSAPNIFTVYLQVSITVWQWLPKYYGLFQTGEIVLQVNSFSVRGDSDECCVGVFPGTSPQRVFLSFLHTCETGTCHWTL